MALRFERLTQADLPMLAEWLRRPHVAECWTDCQTLAEVREQFLPTLTDDSTVVSYIAYLESLPIGYIQSYVAAGAGDGWWPDEHDPGVRGIDQFLADVHSAGHGIGTQMVREFGLSEAIGPVSYEPTGHLHPVLTGSPGHSERTQWLIDREVTALLTRAEARARELLTAHQQALSQLTRALLEHETVTGEQVRAIVAAASPSRRG